MALRRAGHSHGNSDQPSVFERRQLGAHFSEIIQVDFSGNYARTVGKFRQYLSPWVDDHAVPMSFKAFGAFTKLIRRDYVDLVFDRAGAQQRFPMRFPSICREGGRNEDQIHVVLG
jgi:hypothetical protein